VQVASSLGMDNTVMAGKEGKLLPLVERLYLVQPESV
jgi:hypothetical protein